LVRKLLKRASFTSIEDLQARVLAFIEYFNATMGKPHVQGVMAAYGEFLCNNSSIKDIGNMISCRPAD
jgi:hypothetical protein